MKKKALLLLTIIASLFVLMACKEPSEGSTPTPVFTATLLIQDITLTKGESLSIDYQITPAGTFGVVTFEIISSQPASVISITGTTLSALEAGTASVRATATNMAGASQTFTATKDFNVTVLPIPVVDGEYILNGGFEFGLNEWTVTSPFGADAYGTTVVNNYPHGGDAALNLWYDDNNDEASEPIDLKLSQTIQSLPIGTYLFQLWYQGTVESITMTIKAGSTVLVQHVFSGYDYAAPEGHDGYVNYGIELSNTLIRDLTIEIHIIGASESWGYIDDVSFRLGTLDDLVTIPPTGETGYINFIDGGNFSSLTPWTIEITGPAVSKQATLSSGRLSIWANGAATYRISQQITVIEETYNLAIYLNGGVIGTEFNADEAYVYVKQGEVIHKLDLTPEGWNQGVMKRIELSNIVLSGAVEVGIYINFTGGGNNWINLDDFVLWSYELPLTPADVTAAAAVDTLIGALPLVEDLGLSHEAAVVAARNAYNSLTPLQKSFVTHLSKLVDLEAKLELLNLNEEGFINFVDGGDFANLLAWTTEITASVNHGLEILNGRLNIWAHGASLFHVYQERTLIAGTYHMAIYLNGGAMGSEFNVDGAYIYVKQGETLYKENLTPVGWNNGVFKRIVFTGMSLEGDVEIGIYVNFVSGTNNWIQLDNFAVWSFDMPVSQTDIDAADAVDVLILALPELNALTLDDQHLVSDVRAAFDQLTPLQKSFVKNLQILVSLETKLSFLSAGAAIATFNMNGMFESSDWSLYSVGWTATGGNQWVTDWGYESSKSYNPYKDQAAELLLASISNALVLEPGQYSFSIYLAGANVTVKVILGSIEHIFTVTSGNYTLYTFDFTLIESTTSIVIEANRQPGGWLHMDSVSILPVEAN